MSARSFSVTLSNATSKSYNIHSGVPQGSILSPLLFNTLLCDLPRSEEVSTLIYADDITMYVTADTSTRAIELLQPAIDKFAIWATKWGLVLNPQKSVIILHKQDLSEKLPAALHKWTTNHLCQGAQALGLNIGLSEIDMAHSHIKTLREMSEADQHLVNAG